MQALPQTYMEDQLIDVQRQFPTTTTAGILLAVSIGWHSGGTVMNIGRNGLLCWREGGRYCFVLFFVFIYVPIPPGS